MDVSGLENSKLWLLNQKWCIITQRDPDGVFVNLSHAKMSTELTSVFSYGLYFQTGQISHSEDGYKYSPVNNGGKRFCMELEKKFALH